MAASSALHSAHVLQDALGEGPEALKCCNGILVPCKGPIVVHLWAISERQRVGGHTIRLWQPREAVPNLFCHERHVQMKEAHARVEDVAKYSPCGFGIISAAAKAFVEAFL